MRQIHAIVLLITLLVGCSADSKPLSAKSSDSSAVESAKTSEPTLDPEAQAVEGFRLFDKPEPEEAKAVKLWRAACDAGNDLGCTGMGTAYVFGLKGVEKDVAKAKELVDGPCARGNHRACSILGQIFYNAWGVPKDIEKARTLWTKGCDADLGRACYFLGVTYRGSDGPPAWHDEPAGEAFLQKSCTLGYGPGCKTLKDLQEGAEIKKLREVVKTKFWDFEKDGQCTGKGLPPFRKEYEGGTFEQNEKVAAYDGCRSPFQSSNDALRNTFCCPYEKRK